MDKEALKKTVADAAAKIVAAATVKGPETPSAGVFDSYDSLVAANAQTLSTPILESLEPNDAEYQALAERTENLVDSAELVMLIVDKALAVAKPMILAAL